MRACEMQGAGLDGTPLDWKVQRLYIGRHQRSNGAWTWAFHWIGDSAQRHYVHDFGWGSQWPATMLSRGMPMVTYDDAIKAYQIDPCECALERAKRGT